MKIKILVLMFLSVLVLNIFASADSGSLWTDKAADLYQDEVKEYQVGDVVTIVIEEDASAVQSANTSVSQGNSLEAGPGIGILDFITSFSLTYDDEDSADGQTSRTGQLEADVTTTIEEILPNGNFKIVGNKKIKINGEEQIITLSGLIRPKDIANDNTISSKKVANASIEYQGKGIVTEKQKPGLIQRLLNWIF